MKPCLYCVLRTLTTRGSRRSTKTIDVARDDGDQPKWTTQDYIQSWGGWHGTTPRVCMRIVSISIKLVPGMMRMRITSNRFSLAISNFIVNNSY